MSDGQARGLERGLTEYGDRDFSRFLRRAFLRAAGLDEHLASPVVAIADTSSDYVPCHRQMPELVRAIARGVAAGGALPMVFPTMALGEPLLSPTAMLYRNLAAMALEEQLRSQPLDAVVLVGGCDKTVPAHLMAAASAGLPAVQVVSGPMLAGEWRGRRTGACTDCRAYWAEHRAGVIGADDIASVEGALCPTAGTCMVMGTASTMAILAEALGMSTPGSATAPAPTGERLAHGERAGRLAARLAVDPVRPADVLDRRAFHNALVVLAAIGGSTNAIVHLLAIARRAGVPLSLDDIGAVARDGPVVVDVKPSGSGYLEDLHRAGGVPALVHVLRPFLEPDARTVAGSTLGAIADAAPPPGDWQRTIRALDDPVSPPGGLAVVRGSLAPDGAVLKPAAATPALLRHRGRARVFDSPADLAARIDDPALDVVPEDVLVLRNAGPVAAGMPEAGALPLPRRLATAGVRDMVRVSDARMSGTAYGTIVLHCAPEAAVGGPLALVRDGDEIALDARAGSLDLLVDPAELERRRAAWTPPAALRRLRRRIHALGVLQANLGADLDVLAPGPR